MIETKLLDKYKRLMIDKGFSKGHTDKEIKILKDAFEMFGCDFTPENIKEFSYGLRQRTRVIAMQRFYIWMQTGVLNLPRIVTNIGYVRPRCSRDCIFSKNKICNYKPELFIEKEFTSRLCGFRAAGNVADDLPKQWTDVTKALRKRFGTEQQERKVIYRDSHSVGWWGKEEKC